MAKIKVKVISSRRSLCSISGKKIKVHTVPMVTVRGYIADVNKLNSQIKQLEKELEKERRKLYGKKSSKGTNHSTVQSITVKP